MISFYDIDTGDNRNGASVYHVSSWFSWHYRQCAWGAGVLSTVMVGLSLLGTDTGTDLPLWAIVEMSTCLGIAIFSCVTMLHNMRLAFEKGWLSPIFLAWYVFPVMIVVVALIFNLILLPAVLIFYPESTITFVLAGAPIGFILLPIFTIGKDRCWW
ncbi:MAG: hypothetical protein A2261_01360 [Candidatus Magasanikbacteria bacterium RIFOXYA2_FULL_44_8]|uniref:Uncharacterized protein n=1 Tax=Candidatus Magasanikbacteria bacterium RIFOXYA2_FULL_44_8 TaxID=1798696 RepID=A0A1F6NLC3_9BACT|nr:MAG: hypothetical protein A2261_01360 [Candidatus Magasanikbacteria bacterium RIFOXYA2_FULL_44_8]